MDIATLFDRAAAADPARPFITYYDDATGERTELSYLTFDNWVAKTANLLVDEAGLDAGAVGVLRLPPHWLAGAIMVAHWRAGLAVGHLAEGPADIAFVSEDLMDEPENADQVYVVSTAPLAVGLRGEAAETAKTGGMVDFLAEVRGHGDRFTPPTPVGADTTALTGLPGGASRTHGELVEAAEARAVELGVTEGERLMFAGERLRPLDWLLLPLAVGGSVVLSRNSEDSDLEKRAATERARRVG
ncbi:uncharacterized protein (TIGR03089 family) [Stackebrandtia albiflava]|uniref:Uncharacterized protein (TIGR03089 family) n=1 Tax=Stackebrandtia albiflava TaxID=406432 RepID=A0A562VEE8_9ACTN|nr:TIGR03089 family protein [Stackebrandtia albiflava]TWJ16214.1 uncharacterized protein (TIGR03089 family) [Stackebrandtia albiflava]